METILIGGDMPFKPATKALRSLPTKLDAAACIGVLAQIDPDVSVANLAAGRAISLKSLDEALSFSQLDPAERIRLKMALTAHGILSGRKA